MVLGPNIGNALSEHIEYIKLPGRNAAYRKAIAKTLEPDDTVADLGCGVGVLGLFCLEAGASHCWGIDSSEAIHLARESMARAGLADRYTCIAGKTFDTRLPEPVDLIICDHVGYMGFDYGIIGMMRDARHRMLKPGGKVIPQALDLQVAAISSDICRDKAAGWQHELVPEQFKWLDTPSHNLRYHHSFLPDDLLGPPAPLGHLDLASDSPDYFRFTATLTVDRAGRFDGFAGWFDCLLAADTRMTNSPLDPASIRRSQAFLPALESFAVEPGDEIAVSLASRADALMLAWTIQPPRGGALQKLSTLNAMAVDPSRLGAPADKPPVLKPKGAARAFVLGQIDGSRTREAIIAEVLARWPDLLPTEDAIRDFVDRVVDDNCEA